MSRFKFDALRKYMVTCNFAGIKKLVAIFLLAATSNFFVRGSYPGRSNDLVAVQKTI